MAHYVCSGDCAAVVPEEVYNKGVQVCGTSGCSMEGHEFAKHEDDTDGDLERAQEVSPQGE